MRTIEDKLANQNILNHPECLVFVENLRSVA